MRRILFILVIMVSCSVPVLAVTDRDYDELSKEVQQLREEVKVLNNSLPLRGDPSWGTGFIIGIRGIGMFGQMTLFGLELGYSWNPQWAVCADLEEYNDYTGDKVNGYSYAFGFMRRTPLSVNLRGYFRYLVGAVKDRDSDMKVFNKGMFGFEYYTRRNVAAFIETGIAGVFTDSHYYDKYSQGFAMAGIRFYL